MSRVGVKPLPVADALRLTGLTVGLQTLWRRRESIASASDFDYADWPTEC